MFSSETMRKQQRNAARGGERTSKEIITVVELMKMMFNTDSKKLLPSMVRNALHLLM